MGRLIATAFWIFAVWLIRRDTRKRDGISTALWIPTLWAFISLSRPVTLWLGFGGGTDTLEGSPLDRAFYFGIIISSLVVLARRQLDWGKAFAANWPVFLFYAYFLLSVTWSEASIPAFKRWFKDLGNVFVAMVILTERNPMQAIRAVFVRCAYILLPLSVIYIRFIPELGRRYSRAGGLEPIGATMQKNSLGILVLVCGLVLIWEWLEQTRRGKASRNRAEKYLPLILFSTGAYLLYVCDSKTSIVCLAIGAAVLWSIKVPFLRSRVRLIGPILLVSALGFYLADAAFGIKEAVVTGLGRDMTFTGRTDVWRELLALKTDPVLGIGFCTIWSSEFYLNQLPPWVGVSAHNGYLEMYLDGGMVGVFFVVVMLLAVGWRIYRDLEFGGTFSLFRFAIFLAIVIGDFSESHFGRMSSLWFTFLLISLQGVRVPGQISARRARAVPQGNGQPVFQAA